MWGKINVGAIAFLLCSLVALVFAAVAQGLPNWTVGQIQISVPKSGTKGSAFISLNGLLVTTQAVKSELQRTFQQCKEFNNVETTKKCPADDVCCDIFFSMAELEKYGTTPDGKDPEEILSSWKRGLKERCEDLEYKSKRSSVCSKKKRLFGEGEALDSQMKPVNDMITASVILECVGFVVRLAIIVVYRRFAVYSVAFRGYIILPVANVILKILSTVMYVETTIPNETYEMGFTFYIISVCLTILSLVAALVDECLADTELNMIYRPKFQANARRDEPPPIVQQGDATDEVLSYIWTTSGDGEAGRPPYKRQMGMPTGPPPRYTESPKLSSSNSPKFARRQSPSHSMTNLTNPYQGGPREERVVIPRVDSTRSEREGRPMQSFGQLSDRGSRSHSLPRAQEHRPQPRSRHEPNDLQAAAISNERNKSTDSSSGSGGHLTAAGITASPSRLGGARTVPNRRDVRQKRLNLLEGSASDSGGSASSMDLNNPRPRHAKPPRHPNRPQYQRDEAP